MHLSHRVTDKDGVVTEVWVDAEGNQHREVVRPAPDPRATPDDPPGAPR